MRGSQFSTKNGITNLPSFTVTHWIEYIFEQFYDFNGSSLSKLILDFIII